MSHAVTAVSNVTAMASTDADSFPELSLILCVTTIALTSVAIFGFTLFLCITQKKRQATLHKLNEELLRSELGKLSTHHTNVAKKDGNCSKCSEPLGSTSTNSTNSNNSNNHMSSSSAVV